MIIKFNPQKSNKVTTASVYSNVLTLNGESVNLLDIPNGATAYNDYVTIDKDISGNVTIDILWHYVDATTINEYPKDLIIDNGNIYPKESTI